MDADTRQEYCDCPAGFVGDQVTFLTPNCTMPQHVLSIFCVLFIVLWFSAMVQFQRKRRGIKSNKHLMELAQITSVTHLALGGIVLGYFIQGGMFEFAAASATAYYTLLAILLAKVLLFLHNMTTFGQEDLQFRRKMHLVMRIQVFSNTLCGLGVVLSRRNVMYADKFMLTANLSLAFFVSLFGYLAWQNCVGFTRELKRSSLSRTIPQRIYTQVGRLQRNLAMLSLLICSSVAGMNVIRFTMGSVPFLYVLLLPSIICAVFLLPMGVSSLFDGSGEDSKLRYAIVLEPHEKDEDECSDDATEGNSYVSDTGMSGFDVGALVEHNFQSL